MNKSHLPIYSWNGTGSRVEDLLGGSLGREVLLRYKCLCYRMNQEARGNFSIVTSVPINSLAGLTGVCDPGARWSLTIIPARF